MNNVDTTLYNLRPRPSSGSIEVPGVTPSSACPQSAHHAWGPRTWRLIDNQMSLRECSIYRYAPEEDLFDGEDGAVWSLNYFFFNKQRKRVCYLYLRGISILSHSPPLRTPIRHKRFADDDSDGWATPDSVGAKKRARYWLGDRDDVVVLDPEDDQPLGGSENKVITIEDEVLPPPKKPLVDEHDNYILSDEEVRSLRSNSKSTVRGVSEEIADSMEV